MDDGSVHGDMDQALGERGLGAQLLDWLDIHAEGHPAGAAVLDAIRLMPISGRPFSDWCCIPFVFLVVAGDIALQFWGK
jgi:hypothetical protein